MNSSEQIEQAFLLWFKKKAKASGKDPQQLAKELGEEGMDELYQKFAEQMEHQVSKAQYGAKLLYIQYLTAPKYACGGKTRKTTYCRGGKTKRVCSGAKVIADFKSRKK